MVKRQSKKARKTKRTRGNNKKKQRQSKKIKTIIVERQLSDDYMKSKEGEYFDKNAYETIVSSNCDVYYQKAIRRKHRLN